MPSKDHHTHVPCCYSPAVPDLLDAALLLAARMASVLGDTTALEGGRGGNWLNCQKKKKKNRHRTDQMKINWKKRRRRRLRRNSRKGFFGSLLYGRRSPSSFLNDFFDRTREYAHSLPQSSSFYIREGFCLIQ